MYVSDCDSVFGSASSASLGCCGSGFPAERGGKTSRIVDTHSLVSYRSGLRVGAKERCHGFVRLFSSVSNRNTATSAACKVRGSTCPAHRMRPARQFRPSPSSLASARWRVVPPAAQSDAPGQCWRSRPPARVQQQMVLVGRASLEAMKRCCCEFTGPPSAARRRRRCGGVAAALVEPRNFCSVDMRCATCRDARRFGAECKLRPSS